MPATMRSHPPTRYTAPPPKFDNARVRSSATSRSSGVAPMGTTPGSPHFANILVPEEHSHCDGQTNNRAGSHARPGPGRLPASEPVSGDPEAMLSVLCLTVHLAAGKPHLLAPEVGALPKARPNST